MRLLRSWSPGYKHTLGNRKCKYARKNANMPGKMQIIKDYQLY
jgi:hypothetical protein